MIPTVTESPPVKKPQMLH